MGYRIFCGKESGMSVNLRYVFDLCQVEWNCRLFYAFSRYLNLLCINQILL